MADLPDLTGLCTHSSPLPPGFAIRTLNMALTSQASVTLPNSSLPCNFDRSSQMISFCVAGPCAHILDGSAFVRLQASVGRNVAARPQIVLELLNLGCRYRELLSCFGSSDLSCACDDFAGASWILSGTWGGSTDIHM